MYDASTTLLFLFDASIPGTVPPPPGTGFLVDENGESILDNTATPILYTA